MKLAFSKMKTNQKKAAPEHPLFHILDRELPRIADLQAAVVAAEQQLVTFIETGYLAALEDDLRALKEGRNQSSFDDIITAVFEALQPDNPRRELFIGLARKRYKVALVDEFQDTDSRQFAIFKTLFSERTFAMIGDPKQAIYRFRGGDVYAYLAAKRLEGLRPFTLSTNYRSEATLIDGLTQLFAAPGEAPFLTDGIPYHPISAGSAREPITRNGEAVPPLVCWDLPQPVTYKGNGESISGSAAREVVNKRLVAEVSCLLAEEFEIGTAADRRRVRAGDIALLVSGHREAALLKEHLTAAKIPAVTLRSGDLYSSPEAALLLGILEAVEAPGDVKLLRGVLYKAPFRWSLTAIDASLTATMVRFSNYRTRWYEEGVLSMLDKLFREEGLYSALVDEGFEGYRPLTNFRHLLELLHRAETQLGIAPLRLLAELKAAMRTSGDEEQQQRLESDESAVKIVTIHSSKGLEYPVVFAPYLWQLSTVVSEKSDYKKIVHPLFNDGGSLQFDLAVDPDKSAALREKDEEFQRLFYVAATRASQRLYLGCADYYSSFAKTKKVIDEMNPVMRFIRPLQKADAIATELLEEERLPLAVPLEEVTADYAQVRQFDRTVSSGEKTRSYSSIMAHPPVVPKPRATPEPGSIFAFPKGARTGNAWHRIFELINYTHGEEQREKGLIAAMKEYGFREEALSFAPVREMVAKVLRTPFDQHGGAPFSLAMIQRHKRLTEMAFHLRAESVSPAYIREVIEAHEGFTVSIKPEGFSGFMQGFIDLLFEHDGRYYIVDWKSNHLGNSPADYGAEQLDGAMAENEYRLQYILYTVALAKFLGVTQRDFDYDCHMGGAYYVFLRGVTGEGREGLHFHRPKRETVEALAAHFCG